MKYFLLITTFFFSSFLANAENIIENEIDKVNEYIEFVNESIHGLLIVHRLLENNNQEINKYVDLSGYQLNFYTNADLPKDIFEDPDLWFFEISPNTRYKSLQTAESGLGPEWNESLSSITKNMSEICSKVNAIRFEAEDYIKNNDLTEKEKLYDVYKILEKAVVLYEDFYKEQISFSKLCKANIETKYVGTDENFKAVYAAFADVHMHTFNLLHSLRVKDNEGFRKNLAKLKQSNISYASFQSSEAHKKYMSLAVSNKLKEVISGAEEFLNGGGKVPKEYKLYGGHYFYHNSNLINKINRYGNGFVNDMNKTIKKQDGDIALFMEIPHFFQVIYPIRLSDAEYIASSNAVSDLPDQLDSRNINKNEVILDDESDVVYVKLFDHAKKDGDIVSINYNGEWIFKDLSLETEPKEFVLKLNKSGKNYIVIHTENVGIIPPNTTSFSYRIGSKVEEIILETDMATSSLVEFKTQ